MVCCENLLIQPEVLRIILDGQGKSTIDAPDARRPAVQVLGREVTIKGFTVTGGTFGIAINRGATGTIDRNTVRNAAISGLEVSHNGFARIVNNTVERNQQHGILILEVRRCTSVSSARTTRFQGRISSRTIAGMASRCCAPPPPASSATHQRERPQRPDRSPSLACRRGGQHFRRQRAPRDSRGRQFWSESRGLRHALVYAPEHHDETKRSVRYPVRSGRLYRWSHWRSEREDRPSRTCPTKAASIARSGETRSSRATRSALDKFARNRRRQARAPVHRRSPRAVEGHLHRRGGRREHRTDHLPERTTSHGSEFGC